MEAVKRDYAGETAEERAARRRDALVAAAFDLIAQAGPTALRIDKICARAGLNKRYFYESFADLDAVTVAVMDALAQDVITATLGAIPPDAPVPEFVRTGVRALVLHLTEDPRRARVLFGETAGTEAATRRRADALRRLAAVANAQGRALYHVEGGDPMFELVGSMIIGGTRQAVLDFLDGRAHTGAEALAEDLATLWLGLGEAAASVRAG